MKIQFDGRRLTSAQRTILVCGATVPAAPLGALFGLLVPFASAVLAWLRGVPQATSA